MSKLTIKFKSSSLAMVMDTGYREFTSSVGLNGLGKITGSTLSLLAVNATKRRTGQFRRFVKRAKQRFQEIEILEVWNLGLRDVLKRYGFVQEGKDTFRWKTD